MDPSDRISYLLERYLDNTCTRQEMDELLDYVEQHPEDERLMNILAKALPDEAGDADVDPGELTWPEMQDRLQDFQANERGRYRGRYLLKIAASIVMMAACLGVFFFWQESKNAWLSDAQPSLESEVCTSPEEHRLIVLSDGSKVWVNSNSKLSLDAAFNMKTREVTFHGEAFFDIRHDAGKPFIIRTGEVKTTVLGTAFNIRAFPGENAVTVTVARGKVKVEAKNKKGGGTLTANQQITLNLRSKEFEAQTIDAAVVSQWRKGDLILQDITLGAAEEILEERYSVDIRFENALLKKCRFTSTFFEHASLDEVLTAICLVNGASYEAQDKVITIFGKGCEEKK